LFFKKVKLRLLLTLIVSIFVYEELYTQVSNVLKLTVNQFNNKLSYIWKHNQKSHNNLYCYG